MGSEMSPVEVIKASYEAILGRGDIDAFVSFFAEDGVLIEAASLPYGGTFTGPAEIKAALLSVFPHYSEFSYVPEVLTENGEWVIAYGTFSVTAARTGRSISFPLAEASRVVGGKIKLINPVYSDTKALLDILD
jgi:uncharacterized protein